MSNQKGPGPPQTNRKQTGSKSNVVSKRSTMVHAASSPQNVSPPTGHQQMMNQPQGYINSTFQGQSAMGNFTQSPNRQPRGCTNYSTPHQNQPQGILMPYNMYSTVVQSQNRGSKTNKQGQTVQWQTIQTLLINGHIVTNRHINPILQIHRI